MLDLKDTYFTASNIKDTKNIRNNKRHNLNNEITEYEEFTNYEKEKLKQAVDKVKEILKDNMDIFTYKSNNSRTYASFTTSKKLEKKDQLLMKGKINENMYHVEINTTENDKSVIEIHLKNPMDDILELKKGNKH